MRGHRRAVYRAGADPPAIVGERNRCAPVVAVEPYEADVPDLAGRVQMVFLFAQKYFVRGVIASGLKG